MSGSRVYGEALFPQIRHRRRRKHGWVREMVRENHLAPRDFILPLFVHDKDGNEPVGAMPGVSRLSVNDLVQTAKEAQSLGIPALALFPVIDDGLKDERGTESYNENNLVCRSVRAIKEAGVDVGLICDVALDPFTSHGQDGIVEDGDILNDETTEVLCKQAVAQARAGCDIIAPSDMMDGRIGAIRKALDAEGLGHVMILSYAAKYASAFYGPFREAVGSKKNLGAADKRTYQMDPANSDEALWEVKSDLDEGADMVMVKPGLPYLDIIRRVKESFAVPTAAYHVSGEYAMIKAAAEKGWLDGEACMMESLMAIKRAGADMILTYAAMDASKSLGA